MTTIAASTVVTPGGVLTPGVVEIEAGLVTAVAPTTGAVPERTLVPGFVDVQVNGHDDIDVASAAGSEWDRLDALLVAQGVTTWCPTLVTAPLDAYASALERIASARDRSGVRPRIAGAHLEGPFLGGAPGAHRREFVVPIDLAWLNSMPAVVRVITIAPELDQATVAIEALSSSGVLVALGHSTATYEEAVSAAEAGARLVTHVFNGMGAFHHRMPGLVGAALTHPGLAASVIADGVHLHPAALSLAMRALGPGRAVLVTDAVAWRAGRLAEGEVRLVDGAPRLSDGTIAGTSLTMDAAVRRVVGSAAASLRDAVLAASTTPAELVGLYDRGRLVPGCVADVVALRADLTVEQVWIGGEAAR